MIRHLARLLLLSLLVAAPAAQAQPWAFVRTDEIAVCPGDGSNTPPEDFNGPGCETREFWDIDPQNREIWIRTEVELGGALIDAGSPLGLYTAGKAAGAFWINGEFVGRNGQPAASRGGETPGRMDAVLFVERSHLRHGSNELVARLSGHHSRLTLRNPLHYMSVGLYANPTVQILRAYSVSLITFGAFLLGFIFFGVTALRGEDRAGSALLSTLSLAAAGQLLTEASRGIWAYDYPVHDLRLTLIVTFSGGFGLILLAYLLNRFSGLGTGGILLRLGVLTAIVLATIFLATGFDAKAGFAFLASCLAGLAFCALWSWQRKPGALAFLVILSIFCALVLIFSGEFLDVWFFYAVAGLLLFLFWQQALALIRARRERRLEEQRAQRLEAALDQARQKTAPAQIQLVSAGRVDYIATETITQFKGAGDYVEVHFEGGRTSLYNGGLSQLESELPPTFLRVHRSHIVNTAFVSALERDASGVGRLVLSNGEDVPVSRRIMPKVRSALAGTV